MIPPLVTAPTARGIIGYRAAGTGTALVLLHGIAGASQSWTRQLADLADMRRVIAWDCPGYGDSDDLPGEPGLDDYAEALLALADSLGLERFDLLGHSMGGAIAGRFAARHPERVERLILSGTRTGFTRRDPAAFLARVEELRTLPPAEFGMRRATGMAAPDAPAAIRDELAAIAAEARLSGFAAAARMLMSADNAELLGSLHMPTLVVAGALDRIALPQEAEELARAIPGALRVEIPGAAHAPYLEQAERYNAVLRRFLRGERPE